MAEYTAVIRALEWLLENGYRDEKVEVCSDSQLCMFQLQGHYAVRSPRIWLLYERASGLARRFRSVRFRWVPREQNEEADALSRKAYAGAAAAADLSVRLERASELVAGVEHLGGSRYRVRSQSDASKSHAVDLGVPSCECPDFRKRCGRAGLRCKHILAAERVAGGQEQPGRIFEEEAVRW